MYEEARGVINISSVQTSWSKKKVLRLLERIDWESLHLRLPQDWEHALAALKSDFDFESVIDEMENLGQIRMPEDTHVLRSWRPFLEGLVDVGEGKQIQFLQDPLSFSQERQISMDLVALSLKARLGRIELDRWKELLMEEVYLTQRESIQESERLMELTDRPTVSVDLSEEGERHLREKGVVVKRMAVDVPRLPMDLLRKEIKDRVASGTEVPEDLMMKRIKEHLQFLDLILSGSSFDEAYSKWSYDES